MQFDFKRYYCSNKYFSDINLAFSGAVKYDLYTDSNLVGTLITDYDRTFAKFRESVGYKGYNKSWGIITYEHILFDEFEVPFVRITPKNHLFKGDYLTLAFSDGSQSYNLNGSNFHSRKRMANLIVDIKSEGQTVFLLKNTLKGSFFSQDSRRPWEGTIEIADGLHQVIPAPDRGKPPHFDFSPRQFKPSLPHSGLKAHHSIPDSNNLFSGDHLLAFS